MKQNSLNKQIKDSEFFSRCGQELTKIANSSYIQQQRLRRQRKIERLKKQSNGKQSDIAKILLDNLVIDYLRSANLNYSYTVFMRQNNMISDQIKLKSFLVQRFGLKSQFQKNDRINISVIELILQKISILEQKQKKGQQYGVQVELLNKDNTLNNRLLNEIRIAQARKQVQLNQKQHYKKLLETMRQQLTITIKDDLKQEHDQKLKQLRTDYEKQVKTLKQKNKQYLVNSPKLNPKIQEYLSKVQSLQSNNSQLALQIRKLQKQLIVNKKQKSQNMISKQEQLVRQKKQLQRKKNDYQFALKNLHTSVEQLAQKKQKLVGQNKQTDLFMSQVQKNRKNKDYMIEELYGRMFAMDKRIQNLIQDNEQIREQNRQLSCKVKQLQFQRTNFKSLSISKQSSLQNDTKSQKIIKPAVKTVIIGVSEQQIKSQVAALSKENVIDQIVSQSQSEQEQELKRIQRQHMHRMKINELQSDMKTMKNRLKLFVEEFD